MKSLGGMTQEEIADRLGIDQTSVSKALSGVRNPSLKVIKKAMAKLDLRPSFFYGVDEPLDYRNFIGPEPAAPRTGGDWTERRAADAAIVEQVIADLNCSEAEATGLRSIEWRLFSPSYHGLRNLVLEDRIRGNRFSTSEGESGVRASDSKNPTARTVAR